VCVCVCIPVERLASCGAEELAASWLIYERDNPPPISSEACSLWISCSEIYVSIGTFVLV